MSPAAEIARYLAEEGATGPFGGNADWSVHVSREPAEPPNVVTLYDTAGLDTLVLGGGDIRQPGLQVRLRALDYEAGWAMLEDIRRLLALPDAEETGEPIERDIGAGRYVTIAPTGDILAIGRDDKDRHLLVLNFQLIRQAREETS
jgi:hypothetical protein